MPWKLSKDHDGDAEVFLDENPAEPSSSPTVSLLPPIVTEDPIERARTFAVTSKDVDPASGGFGFTAGCKGCSAIINGKRPVAHSHECRSKVMEQAPNDAKIAARVKRAMSKDQEFHARNLKKMTRPSVKRRRRPQQSPRRWKGMIMQVPLGHTWEDRHPQDPLQSFGIRFEEARGRESARSRVDGRGTRYVGRCRHAAG